MKNRNASKILEVFDQPTSSSLKPSSGELASASENPWSLFGNPIVMILREAYRRGRELHTTSAAHPTPLCASEDNAELATPAAIYVRLHSLCDDNTMSDASALTQQPNPPDA